MGFEEPADQLGGIKFKGTSRKNSKTKIKKAETNK
jgi:hypothetical protein